MKALIATAAMALAIGLATSITSPADAAGAAGAARSPLVDKANQGVEQVHYRRRHWRHYGVPYAYFGVGPGYYGAYSWGRPRYHHRHHYYRPYYRSYSHYPRYYRW